MYLTTANTAAAAAAVAIALNHGIGSKAMPVMQCDTRQGQLWMQHDELASSTSELITVKGRRQREFEVELSPPMADDDTNNTNKNGNAISLTAATKRQVNAICEKLKRTCDKNLVGDVDGIKKSMRHHFEEDEEEEDSLLSSSDGGGSRPGGIVPLNDHYVGMEAAAATMLGNELSNCGGDNDELNDAVMSDADDMMDVMDESDESDPEPSTSLMQNGQREDEMLDDELDDDFGDDVEDDEDDDERDEMMENEVRERLDEDDDEDEVGAGHQQRLDDEEEEEYDDEDVEPSSDDRFRLIRTAEEEEEEEEDEEDEECWRRAMGSNHESSSPLGYDREERLDASSTEFDKSNNVTKTEPERRNKRKNFKPRSIVYHQYKEVDNDFLVDYRSGVGGNTGWESSSAQPPAPFSIFQGNPSEEEDTEVRNSLDRRTSSSSPILRPESATMSDNEVDTVIARKTSTKGATDQPLDLSDNATNVKRSLLARPQQHHHHHHRQKERQNSVSSKDLSSERKKTKTSGAPMDLSYCRSPTESSDMNLEVVEGGGRSNCDVMDLSRGHVQSPPSAHSPIESNYATSLTTVPSKNSAQSQRLSTPSPATRSSALSMVANPTTAGLAAGISASLLGLHTGGDRGSSSSPSAHSSASVRAAHAAAAAAAAHAAALGYAQAVRDGHDGPSGPVPGSIDASAMKDYAESTMKELLGLFGLNDMSDSITKDVPLPNFSSVKILENMSNTLGLLPSSVPTSIPNSSPLPHMGSTSSPVCTVGGNGGGTISSRNPQTAHHHSHSHHHHHQQQHHRHHDHHRSGSKSGGGGGGGRLPSVTSCAPSMTTSMTSSSSSSSSSSSTHLNEELYESLHSQVVNSMSKLASLPPEKIIGNPRVILPHNMTTILTLAALQKQKGGSVPSPSSPSSSSSPSTSKVSSRLDVNAPSRLLSASASVLGPGGAPISTSLFKDHHGKGVPIDYSRYVKRYFHKFSSAMECGSRYCKDLNYREHFHCLDCSSRVFVKKEEMIRHFKWHKKRDESLQHGFLRYSPMDDCSDRFVNCAHNRKQTHYHCVKETCDKVYISTSDVQMHANYHRKDSAIIQEGFQRFRATEDCATSACAFSGQRTTHFHCRRSNCNFTFKNKADMEKHKTYHIKDEQLNKDGFKKFMKHESCTFENCRFSRVCNHIHCIRTGCNYVLHSSGQLYSHKRKHERRDNEMAYRKFKLAQNMMRSLGENQLLALQSFNDEMKSSDSVTNQLHNAVPVIQTSSGAVPVPLNPSSTHNLTPDSTTMSYTDAIHQSFSKYSSLLAASGSNQHLDPSLSPHGFLPTVDQFVMMDINSELLKAHSDEIWKKYCSRFTANDPCKPHCDLIYKDHYHCNAENCSMVFRSKDGVRDHARCHEQQDQVTEAFYTTVEANLPVCISNCPLQGKEKHYHCGWQNCQEIILATDKPFRRLDHYKMHEYSHKLALSKDPLGLSLGSAVDGIFKRKRGRPPKNRVVEFPITSGCSEFPQAIYTSFKLPKPNNMLVPSLMEKSPRHLAPSPTMMIPKPSLSPVASSSSVSGHHHSMIQQPKVEIQDGFYVFPDGAACPNKICPYFGKLHYHCTQNRCFYVTDRNDILILHSKDFHDNIDIVEGFAFFDRNIDCRLPGCQSNQVNRHFHCTRPHCNYSFVRYSTMSLHEKKHQEMLAEIGNCGVVRTQESVSVGHGHNNNMANFIKVSKKSVHIKREPRPSLTPSPAPTPTPTPTPPATVMSESRTPSPGGSTGGKPTVVKATGTYYPLSAFPQPYPNKDICGKNSLPRSNDKVTTDSMESIDLRTLAESHVAYSVERSCGRPFCKLKRRDHVHCTFCNQGFTQLSHLQPHIQKHLGGGGGGSSPPGASSSSRFAAMSEDDLSDRADDDDSETISEGRRRRDDETSEESNASNNNNSNNNNRFANSLPSSAKHRGSPCNDSVPSLQAQLPYSASFLATSSAPSSCPVDLLHAFATSHPGYSGISPVANCLTPNMMMRSAAAAAAAEDRHFSTVHHNGSSSGAAAAVAAGSGGGGGDSGNDFDPERSSPRESPPGSRIPSPSDSTESGEGPSSPPEMRRKRSSSTPTSGMLMEDYMDAKKAKMAGMRLLKDEPVPTGYLRYRFNEDCQYTHCGYREHQTHFHCMRPDCGYSFCDKTRFVQHTARHERLDTLMGGDFQQFRANVPCGRASCIYKIASSSLQNKASHFHCLKCEFVCTDTNKVVAHRRQHQKLDSIMAAGFEKHTAVQPCNMEGCAYNQRQTHYHCVKCQYAVLGLSQMSSHKFRHLE